MKGKSKIAVLGVLVVFVAALAVTALQVSASTAAAPAGSTWYLPENNVVGTLSNAKIIAIGKKFTGDFCAGTVSGYGQHAVVVYTGSDPAVISPMVTTNGKSPGTRLSEITKASSSECTDTDLGDIFGYKGTEN